MNNLFADKDKHQWFTPVWAATRLIEMHFSNLTENDFVIEPTCGTGNFLKAIPHHVPAIGIEIDPEIAERARQSTWRQIVTGDFTKIDLPARPTHILGNPPFNMKLIDEILDRCHDILPENGQVGFIMPAYGLQTASRVVKYKSKWSLFQEMIPRNLFKNMEKPLSFVVFTKNKEGTLRGFSLYDELHDVNSMEKKIAEIISTQHSPWEKAIINAIKKHGGKATIEEIYSTIKPSKPTGNNWWKNEVTQTLNNSNSFRVLDDGTYTLSDEDYSLAS